MTNYSLSCRLIKKLFLSNGQIFIYRICRPSLYIARCLSTFSHSRCKIRLSHGSAKKQRLMQAYSGYFVSIMSAYMDIAIYPVALREVTKQPVSPVNFLPFSPRRQIPECLPYITGNTTVIRTKNELKPRMMFLGQTVFPLPQACLISEKPICIYSRGQFVTTYHQQKTNREVMFQCPFLLNLQRKPIYLLWAEDTIVRSATVAKSNRERAHVCGFVWELKRSIHHKENYI